MTFEELCKRWSISPYSSKSAYYDLFKKEGIIEGEKKPYIINIEKLKRYEKKVGFKPEMMPIPQYCKNHRVSKFKALRKIRDNEVNYCILCETEKTKYYRLV